LVPDGEEGLEQAAEAMRLGEAIAYPTDTQYGLGVDALNPKAIQRLWAVKQREPGGTFLVLVESSEAAGALAVEMPDPARVVARTCWPGPVTLLLPARPGLPQDVVSEEGLVAVRVSGHPTARCLPALVGAPVVSTSANISGLEPITDPMDIVEAFAGKLALVLDGGILMSGPPSTIVDGRAVPLRITRAGAVTANSLARRTGLDVEGGEAIPLVMIVCTGNVCRSPMAEGVLKTLLRKSGREGDVDVASAGVAAVSWGSATEGAQSAAWEEGIDISAHHPRQLTPQMTHEADIIITMSEQHRSRIAIIDPEAKQRTYLLKGLATELKGRRMLGYRKIDDPIGRPHSYYRRLLREIHNELNKSLESVITQASARRAHISSEARS